MTNPGPDDEEKLRQTAGPRREAWKATLEQLDVLADERREEGRDVAAVSAIHTDPVTPDMGEDEDRFGLVHVIPDNDADAVVDAFEESNFTEYQIYGRTEAGYRFQITELIDPDTRGVVLIASSYEAIRARGLDSAAREHGVIYTRLKTIDGTPLGVVEHDDYEPLLPDIE